MSDAPPGYIAGKEVSERYSLRPGVLAYHDKELQPIKIDGRKFYALARLRVWAIKRQKRVK